MNAKTSSFATTGSNTFVGNQTITGSLNISGSINSSGTITAQTLVVQVVTSSQNFITGSTKFGSVTVNTHQFTGSVSASGSLNINNGVLFADGGSVGIGTSSPLSKLQVDSALGVDVISISDTTGAVRLALGQESSYTGNYIDSKNIDFKIKTYLGGGSGGNIIFQTGTGSVSEKVRINGAGNVGIGTTIPAYKLDVNGSAWISGTVYINRGVNSTEGYIYFDHSGTQVWKQGIFNNNTSTFSIGNGGGFDRLFNITNAGNVGIGTTSPAYTLDVNGAGRFGSLRSVVLDGTSGKVNIQGETGGWAVQYGFTGNAGTNRGGFGVLGSNDSLSYYWIGKAYNDNALSLDGSTGAATFSSTLSATKGYFSDASGAGPVLEVYNTVATNATTAIIRQTTAGGNGNQDIGLLVDIQGASDSDRIANFRYYNGSTYTSRMTITRGGDVHIKGGTLYISSSAGDVTNLFTSPSVHGFYMDFPSSYYMAIRGSSEFFRIDSSGNVGIGTTSPTAKLSVQGNTNLGNSYANTLSSTYTTKISGYSLRYDASNRYGDYGVLILNSDSSWTSAARKFMLTSGLNSTKFAIIRSADATTDPAIGGDGGSVSSGTADFVITNTGNIGVGGTTAPSAKLDVYAGASTSAILWGQTIRNEDNAATTGYGVGLKLKISGDSVPNELYKWAGIAAVAGTNYSNRTDLAFYTNTNSTSDATEKLRISGDGNVGIGTSDPSQAKLHIEGNNITLNTEGSAQAKSIYFRYSNGGTLQSDSYLRFNTGGSPTEKVRIEAGGNVGIGTTSPAYLLDVAGTIRATGDVIAYSDARVKENVNTITDALTKVTSLRGVSYTRKDTEDKSEKVGVIAQEVLEVLPQVVQQDTEGNYSVAYGNIVGVLIEAIKELKAEIDILKQK
jgi:hypothetical protein